MNADGIMVEGEPTRWLQGSGTGEAANANANTGSATATSTANTGGSTADPSASVKINSKFSAGLTTE